jgi:ABC-2 type transport system permease protein
MRKLLLIGFKDVRLAFRDRAGLTLMLLAPFLLTLGLGAVTGRFSGGSATGISQIQVILINQDGQQLGDALVSAFQSADLGDLIAATVETDPTAAYRQVDDNRAAAAILIPAGFTESIIPSAGQSGPVAAVRLELYANPTAPASVGVVKTIVDDFISRVEVGRVGAQVTVTQLVSSLRLSAEDARTVGAVLGAQQAAAAGRSTTISLNSSAPGGGAATFDVLALLTPGMALMFLMYTASNGGRTLLAEQAQGTLPRLLVSPSTRVEVLGGKVFGVLLTGTLQLLILIGGTSVMFDVPWGDPNAVFVLVLAAVFGAVGWGMLITAVARTPNQVTMAGTALMLTFGILGGSFFSTNNLPVWLQILSKLTPNAWGMDGFTTLASGGGMQDIFVPVLALLVMGAALFAAAVFLFTRRGLAER